MMGFEEGGGAPARRRPENRRRCQTDRLEMVMPDGNVTRAYVTVGFGDDGAALEIFARSGKPDTFVDRELDDIAVLISVAVQHGVPVAALKRSMGRDHGRPASMTGHLLAHLETIAPLAALDGAAVRADVAGAAEEG